MSTSRWSSRIRAGVTGGGVLMAGLALACAPTNLPLESTRWTLVRLESADGIVHVPIIDAEREPAHLVFAGSDGESDPRVSGSGGCNRVSGGYSLEGDQLSFSEMISTRMSCGQDLDADEHRFLDALARVERYEIAGSRLVMTYEGGTLTFDGTAPPAEPPH